MHPFRVVTYNVHRCFGRGGRDSTADVLAQCAALAPDLLALQELDAPETDDDAEAAHKARDFAAALGMRLLFCRTFRRGVGSYGHALLARRPITLVRAATLPGSRSGKSEPRGALWARTEMPSGRVLDVVSTHLGLGRGERLLQARELLGPDWLGSPDMRGARILCGDLNSVAGGRTYRALARHLIDAQLALPARRRPQRTFPSVLPLLRIDHVFVSPELAVRSVQVPCDRRARRASDHLPLVVDLAG